MSSTSVVTFFLLLPALTCAAAGPQAPASAPQPAVTESQKPVQTPPPAVPETAPAADPAAKPLAEVETDPAKMAAPKNTGESFEHALHPAGGAGVFDRPDLVYSSHPRIIQLALRFNF